MVFIIAMCMRNQTIGIPALQGRLFVNLSIFDYLYVEIGGTGYRSVARGSRSYELTLVVSTGQGVTLYFMWSKIGNKDINCCGLP